MLVERARRPSAAEQRRGGPRSVAGTAPASRSGRRPGARRRSAPQSAGGGSHGGAVGAGGREAERAGRRGRPRQRDPAAVATRSARRRCGRTPGPGGRRRACRAPPAGRAPRPGRGRRRRASPAAGRPPPGPGGCRRRGRRGPAGSAGCRRSRPRRVGVRRPAVAGDGALGVVVVQRQRRPRALGAPMANASAIARRIDGAVPRRQQQVEGEALVELVGPGVLGEDVGPAGRVGLGDHHQVAARGGRPCTRRRRVASAATRRGPPAGSG